MPCSCCTVKTFQWWDLIIAVSCRMCWFIVTGNRLPLLEKLASHADLYWPTDVKYLCLCGFTSGMWDSPPPSGLAGGDVGDSLQDDVRRCGIQPQAAQAGCPGGPGLPHTLLQHCQVDSAPVFLAFSRVSEHKAKRNSPGSGVKKQL